MMRVLCRSLLGSMTVLALARPAGAQVQDCQASQFVDRTAPSADRELLWDFGIGTDPERCITVRTGQTVFWNGVSDLHPLGGSGGDNPNPIGAHQDGRVTFNSVGTFGYVCLNHSSMKGAIRVVAAPPAQAVPAASSVALTGLMLTLLASGVLLMRSRRIASDSTLARRTS